jgi:phosphatidate cytidylyltransferase
LLLIPIAVAAILLLPTPWLTLIFGLLTLMGAWEWGRLAGLDSIPLRTLYSASFLPLMAAIWLFGEALSGWLLPLFGLISLGWLLIGVWLFALVKGPLEAVRRGMPPKLLAGLLVLLPAWWACLLVHGSGDVGGALLLFLMVLIWGGDSGAYFAGRRFGKHKLAPAVSPGKSIEGGLGAIAVAVLCGALLAWWLPGVGLIWGLILCVAVMAISIVGDLFESWMKRRAGLKDSGAILPGHGGVLDRIDSLTAAAPLYLLSLLMLGVVR